MPNYLQAISRVLMSAVFIVFGYIQFTHIGNYIANPTVMKVGGDGRAFSPRRSSPIMVATIDLFGGILILVGYQTRWTSIVLDRVRRTHAAYSCTISGPWKARRALPIKRISTKISPSSAALLLIYVNGPGTCSLEHRFAKK